MAILKTDLQIKTVGDNIDGEATHKFVNVKEGTTTEQLDTFGKTIAELADEGYSAAVTVVYDRHDYAG
ncbi:MAG: hypothetical protein L0H99_06790 [Loigolactobacillus coryniformis]|uniref:hypothetical protein n=1 Tax=Loigolactobacillus coryniformis TaxID=1610 RepID=UPI0026499CF8|nr:hypothetical protein [Loigolactobacillus coryniformis]MDN5953595.1 hypothetical protein [Loigolactobacillus coryniformis]MDT3392046.1 hypothetical protein [Bacillota bacterium]